MTPGRPRPPSLSRPGLLLAGGRSSRFGAEKAVAPYAGGLLMDAPLAALAVICAPVAVSARPGSGAAAKAAARGLAVLHDRAGDPDGPLAGLRAGLAWATAQGADALLTAPCDAFAVTAADLRRLIAAAPSGGAALAVSARGPEPLVALWPVAPTLAALDAAFACGRHPPVRHLLVDLGAVEVAGIQVGNANRLSDLPL